MLFEEGNFSCYEQPIASVSIYTSEIFNNDVGRVQPSTTLAKQQSEKMTLSVNRKNICAKIKIVMKQKIRSG